MRLGLLSDVHGNLQALRAVLDRLDDERLDRCACLGDVVGYGGDPEACLDLVARRADVTLMGNHDLAVLEPSLRHGFNPLARAAVDAHASWLGEEGRAVLRTFVVSEVVGEESEAVFLIHGVPGEVEPFTYLLDRGTAAHAFATFGQRFAAVGHTHVPAVWSSIDGARGGGQQRSSPAAPGAPLGERQLAADERAIVNPGSVGQPRDGDPRAACAVLDTARATVRQLRIEYDVQAAQGAILRRGLPAPLAYRLALGR